MSVTWVLVADGSSAKLFHINGPSEQSLLLKDFLHPRTAKKDFALSLDEVEEFDKATPLKPAIDYPPHVEAYERSVFAKEIAHYLEKAHDLNEYNQLIVVSSREMLGELRKALPKSVQQVIEHELGKDLLGLKMSDQQLLKRILNDLQRHSG